MKRKYKFGRAIIAISGLFIPLLAFAAFSISPAKQDDPKLYFKLNAGETATDQIRLSNVGDADGTFIIYAVDAYKMVGGGLAAGSRGDINVSVGRWIKLKEETVAIPAKSSKIVSFEITGSFDSPSGEYHGALVMEEITGSDSSSSFKVRNRAANLIIVTLNNPNYVPPLPKKEVIVEKLPPPVIKEVKPVEKKIIIPIEPPKPPEPELSGSANLYAGISIEKPSLLDDKQLTTLNLFLILILLCLAAWKKRS